jgi:hypothetical protein
MPHFGLMNAESLGEEKAALQRARLHLRGGRRRLREGKTSAGLVTLYDALEFALEWHVSSPARRRPLGLKDGERKKSGDLYDGLVKEGILDGAFDFQAFDHLVEKALHEEMPGLDCSEILAGLESVMTQLGVMPFDEEGLPKEDPATF